MSAPLTPRTERALQLAIDLGERIFILLLFAAFVVRLSHTIGVQPYNVLALISEGLVAFFIVVRRPAQELTMRALDWAVALVGSALAMFVRAGGQPLLPPLVGTGFMFAGLSLAIWAKLSLRRSFGMAAANRGAVSAGPYRFLRHPMYAGYIVVYAGFFLNNPLWWNLGLYIMAILLLVARLRAEEALLKTDPIYDAYCLRVPHRLIPALF